MNLNELSFRDLLTCKIRKKDLQISEFYNTNTLLYAGNVTNLHQDFLK